MLSHLQTRWMILVYVIELYSDKASSASSTFGNEHSLQIQIIVVVYAYHMCVLHP